MSERAHAGMPSCPCAHCLSGAGSLDTPRNKGIWKQLGDEALPLATKAYQAKPGDVKALAVYADSFMFSCSAKGIVKQALSGESQLPVQP